MPFSNEEEVLSVRVCLLDLLTDFVDFAGLRVLFVQILNQIKHGIPTIKLPEFNYRRHVSYKLCQ